MSRRLLVLSSLAFAVAACAVPSFASDPCAKCAPGPTRNVILFVGDGTQLAHEIATSRYLYGRDDALSLHALPYQGQVATWNVTTYNKYGAAAGPRKSPTASWSAATSLAAGRSPPSRTTARTRSRPKSQPSASSASVMPSV